MKNLKFILSGRVQGVCFRAFTAQVARSLNIKGYVRNLYNGDVEIIASGSDETMEEFIKSIKKGPPAARVDSVDYETLLETPDYDTFEIKY